MEIEIPAADAATEEASSLPMLALLSAVVGVLAGLIGAIFRIGLTRADVLRDALIEWARGEKTAGFLLVIAVCAVATAVAASLVARFSPHASGSGIPHVEAVLHRQMPQAPYRLIPVKFLGGILAIGSGLALGREGPSVQMGASIAHLVGRLFRRNLPDCLTLLAAGAGAGLSTAFNAPVAGAVFVLEELARRFDTRTTIATFGASASAIAVSRVIQGDVLDFDVKVLPYSGYTAVAVSLLLGAICGFLGILYNRTLLGTLDLAARLKGWPPELYAGLIGGVVGALALVIPDLVGGGDAITQRALVGGQSLRILPMVFLFRLALGAVSYSAKTPGGLFAPMLVLGAVSGLTFGKLCGLWFPSVIPDPTAMAVVGMAAFFTAVVRAPVTGIILVTEMTGNYMMLLPMLAASFTAMLVPTVLRDAPIYDSLRLKLPR